MWRCSVTTARSRALRFWAAHSAVRPLLRVPLAAGKLQRRPARAYCPTACESPTPYYGLPPERRLSHDLILCSQTAFRSESNGAREELIMRVIRTETYFDGNYIQRRVDKTLKTTDVCFAWINFERTGRLPTEQLPDLEGAREIHPDQVPLVLDYILRRERIQPFVDPHESILNGSAIEQVLNEPIVIEQSPLDTETLPIF